MGEAGVVGSVSSRRRGVAQVLPVVVVAVVVVALSAADVEMIQGLGALERVRLVADVLLSAAAVAAVAGRGVRVAVAVGVAGSLLLSGVLVVAAAQPPALGAAELAGLLVLAVAGVRAAAGGREVLAVIAAVAVAVVGGGLARATPGLGTAVDLTYLGLVVVAAAVAGLWWRASARDREQAAAARAQRQRLELARELHDVVAHHVTGIVVQTQALQIAGAGRPEVVLAALPELERAASRSLAAMRAMVGALRAADQVAPPEREGDLAGELREVIAESDLPVHLEVNGDLDVVAVPRPVAQAVRQVVAESLVNVVRHAGDATRVDVGLAISATGVVVEVVDDGHGSTRFQAGAGVGLVGLGERVRLLDGELRAGAVEPFGWRVVATLPLGGGRR